MLQASSFCLNWKMPTRTIEPNMLIWRWALLQRETTKVSDFHVVCVIAVVNNSFCSFNEQTMQEKGHGIVIPWVIGCESQILIGPSQKKNQLDHSPKLDLQLRTWRFVTSLNVKRLFVWGWWTFVIATKVNVHVTNTFESTKRRKKNFSTCIANT